MSRDHDRRSSRGNERFQAADDRRGADRRGSCRYPVAEVPALLGWWETHAERVEQGTSFVEAEKPSVALNGPKRFDTETYSAIMARGPMLRGGFHANAAAKAATRHTSQHAPHHGRAGVPALAGGKSEVATAARPKASTPALREKTETRREASATGQPQLQQCQALIIDISNSGISLASEADPVEGQAIWVRLDGIEPSEWVEGTVAGISRREPGTYLVRIRFKQACPYDFFKATVYRSKES